MDRRLRHHAVGLEQASGPAAGSLANNIPVGSDGGGGIIVVVAGGPHRGQVWFEDRGDSRPEGANPRVTWFDRRDVAKLADTFGELMHALKPLQP